MRARRKKGYNLVGEGGQIDMGAEGRGTKYKIER